MNFVKYIQTAFVNRWNLLALLGASGFAMLSGRADVLLPLVVASEVAYLGLLSSRPRFQQYVDAQEAQAEREEATTKNRYALDRILRSLPKPLLARYDTLRTQCVELRQIAKDLKNPVGGAEMPFEESQTAGFNRLLWIYLRLLYTQFSLSRFLQKTDPKQLQSGIDDLKKKLQQVPAGDTSERWQRMRRTIEESMAIYQARLENLNKARENFQLIELQIDQLENKIRSLSEMAVNHQEPEYVSSQVEHVASTMVDTERTMNELQFATGLHDLEDEPPDLVRAQVAQKA